MVFIEASKFIKLVVSKAKLNASANYTLESDFVTDQGSLLLEFSDMTVTLAFKPTVDEDGRMSIDMDEDNLQIVVEFTKEGRENARVNVTGSTIAATAMNGLVNKAGNFLSLKMTEVLMDYKSNLQN